MMVSIPLILVSGPLGSGKTSLLRHLMEQNTGLRFAVIVNDFGEVGIDGDLLRQSTSSVIELANGCICCAEQSEIPYAIRMVLTQSDPDYIVIEMSGEGDPIPVIRLLRTVEPLVKLTRLVGVLDLSLGPEALIGDFVTRNALLSSDLLILNKSDIASVAQTDTWRSFVTRMNSLVETVETHHSAVDTGILLRGVKCRRKMPVNLGHAHEHRHQALASYCFRTDGDLDPGCLIQFMDRYGSRFVRAKGFVQIDGQTHEFQVVRGQWSLTPFAGDLVDRGSRIVFLSRDLARAEMLTMCETALAPEGRGIGGAQN